MRRATQHKEAKMRLATVYDPGRRLFLTRVAPACALLCFGAQDVLAAARAGSEPQAERADAHKFDGDIGRQLTVRQYFDSRYGEYILLAKAIEKEMGRERATEFLKKFTTDKMTEYGKRQADRLKANDFESYVSQFRSGYDKTLTMEIVEDADTAFEIKVTECIWADVFRRADAGDIGYCSVCWGDYAWAKSFNEKISLVRDKTLMQGHDYCNHRYIWTA
jgi:hypothetical protein